ncbi:hypothetical protein QR680_003598 [Steinernema hermaphroditum]|uniref:Uncharacterized protein n=1 Tax=Steinernema hermaphroditum TaxID=289476 RepID=A0AA39LS84_9BILA|nr:hypothetical protein QR680_003598 [Steinernema hermaphroditum]
MALTESSYYIDQRLTSESIFYDHFNYVLTTWIESFPNNVAKEDFRYDLLKLVNSQETSEDKCGYSRAEFTDISLNNTVASVEANKDLNEIWEDVEIHLRFLGYSRSSVIQHFVADFIEYNKDKTPEKLEKLVDPWEKKVKTFISKTVPRRLQERAEVFWAEFTRSHTAGVKEKCMRFLPDTSIVEWKTVIEEYKNAFVQMKTDCVPNGQKMEHPQFKFFDDTTTRRSAPYSGYNQLTSIGTHGANASVSSSSAMAYVDSHGNVVNGSRPTISGFFSKFITAILFFFQSLLRPFFNVASDEVNHRNRGRNGGSSGGGGGGWPGSGGPGGPGNYRPGGDGGFGRRPIGRLNRNSGMSCTPVGG